MSEKIRQNRTFVMQKANHLGIALFAFVVLAGTVLWLTGNLHFGSQGAVEAAVAYIDDRHERNRLA